MAHIRATGNDLGLQAKFQRFPEAFLGFCCRRGAVKDTDPLNKLLRDPGDFQGRLHQSESKPHRRLNEGLALLLTFLI
jgi:hypothetical protein